MVGKFLTFHTTGVDRTRTKNNIKQTRSEGSGHFTHMLLGKITFLIYPILHTLLPSHRPCWLTEILTNANNGQKKKRLRHASLGVRVGSSVCETSLKLNVVLSQDEVLFGLETYWSEYNRPADETLERYTPIPIFSILHEEGDQCWSPLRTLGSSEIPHRGRPVEVFKMKVRTPVWKWYKKTHCHLEILTPIV